jgi:ElaB/YqjD/DUF883 family membrane-anchored ribosome-binding protein
MARRRRVPVVGPQQLHPVQISPEIRKLEARRTKAAAHRAAAPVLAADRGEFGFAKKQYRNEAASARGATSAVEGALAQALAGLKGSGLSGTALQQTKSEFTSRAADAASALPSLLAGAQEERNKTLAADRQNLVSDRAQMQQSAAEAYNEKLKELRETGSSALKSQSQTASSNSKEAGEEIKRAIDEGKRLLAAYPKEQPSNPQEWAQFAGQIENAEGVGEPGAIKAAEILRKLVAVKKVRAKVNPFG